MSVWVTETKEYIVHVHQEEANFAQKTYQCREDHASRCQSEI